MYGVLVYHRARCFAQPLPATLSTSSESESADELASYKFDLYFVQVTNLAYIHMNLRLVDRIRSVGYTENTVQ